MRVRAIAAGIVVGGLFAYACGGTDGAGLIPADDAGAGAPDGAEGVDVTVDTRPAEDTGVLDGEPDGRADAPHDAPNEADSGKSCTADDECSPPATICDTQSRKCIPNTCPTANQTCPVNPADVCCAAAGGNECVPGNCCTSAQCSGSTPACTLSRCKACDAVNGPPYRFHVDPLAGSDLPASTGSGTAGALASVCALKTITRALQLVPSPAPAGTEIVVDVTSTVGPGETFPIVLPANVTIRGAAGTTVRVAVAANEVGFQIASAGSGLANLVVDGQATTAASGVVALDGAAAAIVGVEVKSFQGPGIQILGGTLGISGGTFVHQNGSLQLASPGLYVEGTGNAIISGGTDQTPTSFSQNMGNGIQVTQNGSVSVNGAPSLVALGTGTVVATGNSAAGVSIAQALVNGPPFPPASTLDGLVATMNGGHGVEIFGGSAARARNCVALRNTGHGVHVLANPNGGNGQGASDISRIDLGVPAAAGYGKNIVQDPLAANQGVGICLSLGAGGGTVRTLQAAGNIFGPTLNCSTTMANLTPNQCTSGSKGTVGIQGVLDTIDVSLCKLN